VKAVGKRHRIPGEKENGEAVAGSNLLVLSARDVMLLIPALEQRA